MIIVLSSGERLNVKSTVPAKRRTKGAKVLKKHHAVSVERAVGGFRNDFKAITAPSDYLLCVVREPSSVTFDLGGSTRSPYRGGRGA